MNFDRLDEFLRGLEKMGRPGTDCAIYQDGKLIHRHMYGLSDRENGVPITENTIYRMFSMTKPVTCAAMLQLYERGHFLLTDPVSMFLPEFAHMQVQHQAALEAAPITMRQLFTMTAGLTYDLDTPYLQKLYREKPDYSTRDFVGAVAQSQLLYQPGTHWCYSLAHDVLAACVEAISGMRFSEYLKKNIFEPLDMHDVWFHVPQDKIALSCVRYVVDERTGASQRESTDTATQRFNTYQRGENFESGGAGLSTTVNDYAKFAMMLANLGKGANGVRVLSEDTVNLMRENQLTDAQMNDFNWIQFTGYGYGLGVRTLLSRAAAGALGKPGEFGWSGAAGTYLIVDPDKRLAVVYAQQTAASGEAFVQPRLRNMIYAGLGR